MPTRLSFIALIALAVPSSAAAQSVLPATITDAQRPRVRALATSEVIRVDGRLTEAIWSGPALNGFTQAEPREGQPATEESEVWVAYSSDNLYVAAHLHDSQEPVVNDIRKDFNESSQDVFQVILDTFRDRRSGYVFQTNPEGARGDRQTRTCSSTPWCSTTPPPGSSTPTCASTSSTPR